MSQNRIAAIVLAAGMSQRMGRLKPLLPFGDKPMLARVVENLQTVETVSPIIVVTGHAAPDIRSALVGYPVTFTHNDSYAMGGMLSSVQTGVQALPNDIDAFLLVLGDQPMVAPATIELLLTAWLTSPVPRPTIVLPTYEGRRGHPVLFAIPCAAEILTLPTDETLKTCVTRHKRDTIEMEVSDPAILADVDTPEDYEQALHYCQASSIDNFQGKKPSGG